MKKIFALILALSLVACMALSVSADTIDMEETDNSTGTVTISKKTSAGGDTELDEAVVYSVDVAWANTALVYQYQEAGVTNQLVWDPASHTYTLLINESQAAGGDWTTSDPITATVTNHSNEAVTATLTGTGTQNGVTFACTDSEEVLANAAEGASLGDVTKAPAHTFEITYTGTPAKSFTIDFTITIE